MTRWSPIPLRRSCPDSAKSWSNLAEMSRFAACGASAIFSGRHKPDDVNHQDTGAFARRDCHRNLSRHARHRYLVRSGARPRAKILPNSLGYPQSRDGRRHGLDISSKGIEELKSHSPSLWYVVSYDNLMNEFGR